MKSNKERLLAFLTSHHLASLATVSPTGQPHATAIYYFVDPDFNFHFITKNNTRKCGFLRHDGRVGLEIVDESARQTVQVEGVTKEVVDPLEFGRMMDAFQMELRRNPAVWADLPISHIPDGYCIFTIQPKWICWSDFRRWDDVVLLELNEEQISV